MTNKAFETFLLSQQIDSPETISKAKNRKALFLKKTQEFFASVESFIAQYVDRGQIRIVSGETILTEEWVGTYKIENRTIEIGGKEAHIVPVGAFIFGAKGRIDMIYRSKTVRFVLVEPSAVPAIRMMTLDEHIKEKHSQKLEEEPVWKIASPPPRITFTNFDQDTFLLSLMDVFHVQN